MKKVFWLDALSLFVSISGLIVGVYFCKHPFIVFSRIQTLPSAYIKDAFELLEFLSLLYSIIMLMAKDAKRWIWLVPNIVISAFALFLLSVLATRAHAPFP